MRPEPFTAHLRPQRPNAHQRSILLGALSGLLFVVAAIALIWRNHAPAPSQTAVHHEALAELSMAWEKNRVPTQDLFQFLKENDRATLPMLSDEDVKRALVCPVGNKCLFQGEGQSKVHSHVAEYKQSDDSSTTLEEASSEDSDVTNHLTVDFYVQESSKCFTDHVSYELHITKITSAPAHVHEESHGDRVVGEKNIDKDFASDSHSEAMLLAACQMNPFVFTQEVSSGKLVDYETPMDENVNIANLKRSLVKNLAPIIGVNSAVEAVHMQDGSQLFQVRELGMDGLRKTAYKLKTLAPGKHHVQHHSVRYKPTKDQELVDVTEQEEPDTCPYEGGEETEEEMGHHQGTVATEDGAVSESDETGDMKAGNDNVPSTIQAENAESEAADEDVGQNPVKGEVDLTAAYKAKRTGVEDVVSPCTPTSGMQAKKQTLADYKKSVPSASEVDPGSQATVRRSFSSLALVEDLNEDYDSPDDDSTSKLIKVLTHFKDPKDLKGLGIGTHLRDACDFGYKRREMLKYISDNSNKYDDRFKVAQTFFGACRLSMDKKGTQLDTLQFVTDESMPKNIREQALNSLIAAKCPQLKTVDALETMGKATKTKTISHQALLVLGAILRNQRECPIAQAQVKKSKFEKLERDLNERLHSSLRAKQHVETSTVLYAMANSAADHHFHAIRQALHNHEMVVKSVHIRAAARLAIDTLADRNQQMHAEAVRLRQDLDSDLKRPAMSAQTLLGHRFGNSTTHNLVQETEVLADNTCSMEGEIPLFCWGRTFPEEGQFTHTVDASVGFGQGHDHTPTCIQFVFARIGGKQTFGTGNPFPVLAYPIWGVEGQLLLKSQGETISGALKILDFVVYNFGAEPLEPCKGRDSNFDQAGPSNPNWQDNKAYGGWCNFDKGAFSGIEKSFVDPIPITALEQIFYWVGPVKLSFYGDFKPVVQGGLYIQDSDKQTRWVSRGKALCDYGGSGADATSYQQIIAFTSHQNFKDAAGPDAPQNRIAVRWEGVIQIQKPGDYKFWTKSDDGSWLIIGIDTVVDNSGMHGAIEKEGERWMDSGWYSVVIKFFENSGGEYMEVKYQGPDTNGQKVHLPGFHIDGQLSRGFSSSFYYFNHDIGPSVPDVIGRTPDATSVNNIVAFTSHQNFKDSAGASVPQDRIAVVWKGFFKIKQEGYYNFYTKSDDGSRLWIGTEKTVDNDGYHGAIEAVGYRWMDKGTYSLRADFFENTGGEYMEIMYQGPDTAWNKWHLEGYHMASTPATGFKGKFYFMQAEVTDFPDLSKTGKGPHGITDLPGDCSRCPADKAVCLVTQSGFTDKSSGCGPGDNVYTGKIGGSLGLVIEIGGMATAMPFRVKLGIEFTIIQADGAGYGELTKVGLGKSFELEISAGAGSLVARLEKYGIECWRCGRWCWKCGKPKWSELYSYTIVEWNALLSTGNLLCGGWNKKGLTLGCPTFEENKIAALLHKIMDVIGQHMICSGIKTCESGYEQIDLPRHAKLMLSNKPYKPRTQSLQIADADSCDFIDAASYRGNKAVASGGLTCLDWPESWVKEFDGEGLKASPKACDEFPAGGNCYEACINQQKGHNFCRDPTGTGVPFCRTGGTEEVPSFTNCDLKACDVQQGSTHSKVDGSDYNGQIAETITGKACILWSEADIYALQTGVASSSETEKITEQLMDHAGSDFELMENFCRNFPAELHVPGQLNKLLAWCPVSRDSWEYCNVGPAGEDPEGSLQRLKTATANPSAPAPQAAAPVPSASAPSPPAVAGATLPLAGLYAHYTAASFNLNGAGVWTDMSGNARDATTVAVEQMKAAGAGAPQEISFLHGDATASIVFPDNSIPETFTICSLSRYGSTLNRGKILRAQGDDNWFHGHFGGYAAVAKYDIWMTKESHEHVENSDWTIVCGQNGASPVILSKGQEMGLPGIVGGQGGKKLCINDPNSFENSDWQVAAITIWNRLLDEDEMWSAYRSYTKYLAGQQSLSISEA